MNEESNKLIWPGWETVRVLGRGSYGAVYEVARDSFGVREKAAVKCISLPQNPGDIEDLFGDGYDAPSVAATYEAQLKQILQEYQLMAELRGNAHVVRSDDISCEHQDNGLGWNVKIKMELLTPMNRAKVTGTVEQQALRLGQDLCLALIECKNKNIVHRDIKPQNIFVSDRGDFKLGDFGIARTMEKTTGATKTGTYNYMAPEVYHERPYGHQADVYSLGMVLYWLLNERRGPFLPLPPQIPTATQQEQARLRRFGGEPLPPPKNGSEGLKAIVLKACSGDPKQRFAHAGELYNELEALRNAEKERIAAPVTRSPVRHDSVGADALGGPTPGGSTGQNPSGPAGHLHPPLCPPRGHLSPPGRVFPLQGRQETTNAKAASNPVGAIHESPAVKPKKKAPLGLILGLGAAVALLIAVLLLLPRLRGGAALAPAPTEEAPVEVTFSPDAEFFEADGLTYVLDGSALTVTGEGRLTAPGEVIPEWETRRETLERVVLGEGITAIRPSSFSVCPALRDVRLPESLQVIDNHAFYACKALKSIELPAAVRTIGANAFQHSGLETIALPEGLETVYGYCFFGCSSLRSIYLPASVTEINTYAFRESGLQEVRYGGSAEEWDAIAIYGYNDPLLAAAIRYDSPRPGEGAETGEAETGELTCTFEGTKLTVSGAGALTKERLTAAIPDWNTQKETVETVEIKPGVTAIGDYAFSSCKKLTSVSIPQGVREIGEGAFKSCESLPSITIPEGVTTIGASAFHFCKKLTSVTLSQGLTTIGGNAFKGCRALTSITLPKGVAEIGAGAFQTCSGLESVTLPKGLTKIGESAFSHCESLTSVTIPEGVTEIGHSAFNACLRLSDVSLPSSLTEISLSMFVDCTGLTSITVPEGVTGIDQVAFANCYNLTSIYIPASATRIANAVFYKCLNLSDIYFGGTREQWEAAADDGFLGYPDRFVTIHYNSPQPEPAGGTDEAEAGELTCTLEGTKLTISGAGELTTERLKEAFPGWGVRKAGLETIEIQPGVTEIGKEVFMDCESLTSVSIPDGVTKIGDRAFHSCDHLASLALPEGVTEIGYSAFWHCNVLKSVRIPKSVVSIDDVAFTGCWDLTDIYYGGSREDWERIGFGDVPVNATVHYNSN